MKNYIRFSFLQCNRTKEGEENFSILNFQQSANTDPFESRFVQRIENIRNKKRKFLRKEKIIELPLFEESNTKEHKVKKKRRRKEIIFSRSMLNSPRRDRFLSPPPSVLRYGRRV